MHTLVPTRTYNGQDPDAVQWMTDVMRVRHFYSDLSSALHTNEKTKQLVT
jgi:hypothetical protein